MAEVRDIPVAELMQLSDAELVEFMARHRKPDGSITIPVNDDGVDESQLSLFVARLKTAKAQMSKTERPLDLGYLDARIHDLLKTQSRQRDNDADTAHLPVAQPQATTNEMNEIEYDSVTEVPDYDMYEEAEKEAHRALIADGGRPLYPIRLLRDVLDNTNNHWAGMLRPFWNHPRPVVSRDEIFRRQQTRWRDFRDWQLDNRGIKEADDGYNAYVSRLREWYLRIPDTNLLAELDANLAADPLYLARPWTWWWQQKKRRAWKRCYQREPGCREFSSYRIAAYARLARHGHSYSYAIDEDDNNDYNDNNDDYDNDDNKNNNDPRRRREFQLDEDPKRQDALTTWLEYLCFEYWWQDHYDKCLAMRQTEHDAAWAKLQDSGVLLPGETAEFMPTDACRTQVYDDMRRTRAAVLAAQGELEKTAIKERLAKRKMTQRLEAAMKENDRAEARALAMEIFRKETKEYRAAQEDVKNQPVLVEWVVQQLELVREEARVAREAKKGDGEGAIAAEVAATQLPPAASTQPESQSRRKRSRNEVADDGDECHPHKRENHLDGIYGGTNNSAHNHSSRSPHSGDKDKRQERERGSGGS
ncbi:hypothetical protein CCM_04638 [Cordyceps militaris CM01]|uniref:Ankyrin 2,3/unc44 n=1 Tax=Cordyceps militaris (strain CM01) TaxID=983644 RepID=G3JGD5_CORMM|nr:uncharacterized protein CCM_04638 [Cordyceps militaris CM01]EGX93265.1 hypothetical protein CCM_04638 [Cordyceps militaris CM01]